MIILGISPPDHECAAALIADGRLVAAASEERFTRVKNQGGFPARALDAVLAAAGIGYGDVDAVAVPWLSAWRERRRDVANYVRHLGYSAASDAPLARKAAHLGAYSRNLARQIGSSLLPTSDRARMSELRKRGLDRDVRMIDHHAAHIAAAYYCSGQDKALGVSLDGYGSGAAGSFYLCEGSRIRLLQSIPYPNSLGTFYRRVTQALGFTPDRHEGKVLGLAAHGDPDLLFECVFADFDLSAGDHFRMKAPQDPYQGRRLAARYRREDVAAAYQKTLETVAAHYVGLYCRRHGLSRVVAAGGVFANVRMNQRIAELPEVDELFVFPAMGDSGTGAGAALLVAAQEGERANEPLAHVYLGPGFGEKEIGDTLRAAGADFEHHPDVEGEVARRVAEGEVVARFDGGMEFGPRALGNRSILCGAEDPSVNDWLNKRLRRTEFMPFAPAVREERAASLFDGLEAGRAAARFMTMTFNCTARMKGEAPAAVHVDGTARPQLVGRRTNAGFYRILSQYERLTGRSAIINTSFNMHEEPIVCTPADALRAWRDGALDCLAIGSFTVTAGGTGQRRLTKRLRSSTCRTSHVTDTQRPAATP